MHLLLLIIDIYSCYRHYGGVVSLLQPLVLQLTRITIITLKLQYKKTFL